MKRLALGLTRAIGAALYKVFVATLTVAFIGGGIAALANYNFTQGSGTAFGSIVVSAVHYAQMLLCDPTTPSQCIAVSAGGAANVDGSAVTQPISAASLPTHSVNVNDGAGNALTSSAAGATRPLDITVRDTSGNAGSLLALGPAAIASAVPTAPASQYPTNATTTTPAPITGNATGTTGAVVGTLAAAASVTTHICGFNVSAIGGTAAVGPVTVAGLVGSSQVYQLTATAGGVMLQQTFNPCIPASAVNTAITVTTTADGTATAVDVNSWGYRL